MNDYVRKKALACKRKFNTSDPFKLARALGIEVMVCDIGSRLGCYMYLKRSKCIWINEEANAFAAELLISDDAILEAKANSYTIDQLSRILGYEKELIQLRLK